MRNGCQNYQNYWNEQCIVNQTPLVTMHMLTLHKKSINPPTFYPSNHPVEKKSVTWYKFLGAIKLSKHNRFGFVSSWCALLWNKRYRGSTDVTRKMMARGRVKRSRTTRQTEKWEIAGGLPDCSCDTKSTSLSGWGSSRVTHQKVMVHPEADCVNQGPRRSAFG